MKYRQEFTLIQRHLKCGTVWYYRYWDEDENKRITKSTHQKTKSKARAYVENLMKKGKLFVKEQNLKFGDYAADWWVWDKCDYVKQKKAVSSQKTVKKCNYFEKRGRQRIEI